LKYSRPREASGAAAAGEIATVKLRYKPPGGVQSKLTTHVVRDSGKSFAQAGSDFQFGASVAAFGMRLRGSEHKGNTTDRRVRDWARAGLAHDPNGDRAEFLRLVR
jgi:Ca-activated chloride channel family protein